MLPYVVEFLGTFLFASVIFATEQPMLVSLTLFLILLLGSGISGGHYNPAISIMYGMNGLLTPVQVGGYVLSQIAGSVGALGIFRLLHSGL
jgi:glycerol uptake facilitator-like aquaporin